MEQDGDEEEHQTPCFQPPALRVEDLRGRRLVLANLSNGIMYPHDDVCYFASQMAHHKPQGYFNAFAMPIRAVIVLLLGGELKIVDATRHDKPLSDALKKGVPTWCLLFNRAIKARGIQVCPWQTDDMAEVANSRYRKLAEYYGHTQPAVCGTNVHLECHAQCTFDDKPEEIAIGKQLPSRTSLADSGEWHSVQTPNEPRLLWRVAVCIGSTLAIVWLSRWGKTTR
eukprot:TRINITY_DN11695_c0_g1_i5.p1 TRINITY_DN11695_c0_g1~~TRINITY_DN11695_c0_g1_i5.p1  ORF type:complete len:226 (+),score=37.34 TRINITY_DN11695_c0_g1_i5:206-883(+)